MLKFAAVVMIGLTSALGFSEPIEVVCDEFGEGQCQETREMVAAVEALSTELFGVDVSAKDDGAKLELHLLAQDYFNADELLNNGRFKRNWAFANFEAMQGHIALQPPVPTELLEVAGLPVQTKVQIAHEAVHLCIYRAFPNHRSHPGWLSEGLAEYMSNESVRRAGYMGAIEDEPWTCREIIVVRRLFEDHPEYTVESILDDVSKDISSGRLYSVRALFVEWLREIGAFDDMISEARRLGGGDEYDSNLKRATLDAISAAGVEHPDEAFKAWVGAFEPQWDEVYRSLSTNGDVWMQGAFDRNNSICWNNNELGDRDWVISGSMKIFEGDKTQMNILLGRDDIGYVKVAVGTEWGATVYHRVFPVEKNKRSKWIKLGTKEIKSNTTNEWIDFKISKRRNRLMVKIGKQRPIRVELGDIDVTGRWGLGVQNKSAGLWRDVKVER
jgi:hypothetical protein